VVDHVPAVDDVQAPVAGELSAFALPGRSEGRDEQFADARGSSGAVVYRLNGHVMAWRRSDSQPVRQACESAAQACHRLTTRAPIRLDTRVDLQAVEDLPRLTLHRGRRVWAERHKDMEVASPSVNPNQ
jgi:hypothetical protein